MKLCCVDVGTNSVLSLLSRIDSKGRIIPLQFHAETTRLGKSLKKKNILNKKPQFKTISAIKKHLKDANRYLIVGTSALREAKNSDEFIRLLFNETGQKIKILSETQEAGLVFDSIRHYLKPLPKKIIICDIGGGSTEFIICINPVRKGGTLSNGVYGRVIKKISIPVGAVNLTERFKNNFSDMESFIRSKIEKIPIHSPVENYKLICVGGTVTTLGAIIKGLKHYDPKKVHKIFVPYNKVILTLKKLISVSLSKRKKIISFDPKRADIIVAGIYILKVIMEVFCIRKFRICDKGLVWGLAVNYSKYTRGTFNLHKIS